MKEAGVLEDYLRNIKHHAAKKHRFREDFVVYEPMTSHLDVSTPFPTAPCLYTMSIPFPPPSQLPGIRSPPASRSERWFFPLFFKL